MVTKGSSQKQFKRQYPRFAVSAVPSIVGSIDFLEEGEVMVDLGFGGCRFQFLEDQGLYFMTGNPFKNEASVYVCLDWKPVMSEPIVLRGDVCYQNQLENEEGGVIWNLGICFDDEDRIDLAPILEELERKRVRKEIG